MKILILGSDGMVGHVVVDYMREQGHEVETIKENDTIIWEFEALKHRIKNSH